MISCFATEQGLPETEAWPVRRYAGSAGAKQAQGPRPEGGCGFSSLGYARKVCTSDLLQHRGEKNGYRPRAPTWETRNEGEEDRVDSQTPAVNFSPDWTLRAPWRKTSPQPASPL